MTAKEQSRGVTAFCFGIVFTGSPFAGHLPVLRLNWFPPSAVSRQPDSEVSAGVLGRQLLQSF
jgi:hypothetical protein